jgi:hypothetical protein
MICKSVARRALAGAGLAAMGLGLVATASIEAAAQGKQELTVTITKFHALDRADDLSQGDFFARVTIDGEAQSTGQISDQAEVSPKDWKISKSVSPGVHKVKLELMDKDVSVDDPIDVNRVDKKRDIDFAVDTKSCRVEGFSESYKCGATITRAGGEKKKASISFTVSVK